MIDNKTKYWNIVKGIGILSIVLGHCCEKLVPFVYLYHLAIFFFVSGYFYNEKKYGRDPLLNFTARLKKNWKKFSVFSLIILFLHNPFVRFGMISGSYYSISDTITASLNTLLFFGTEALSGTLWFVPVLILSSTLFGIIVSSSIKISEKFDKISKDFCLIIFNIVCMILGYYLAYKNISLMLHIQTIFIIIPFFTVGYYMNKIDFKKYLKFIPFIICFCILIYFSFFQVNIIDLSKNILGDFYLFYIVSFAGIYFCLYIANIISKLKITGKWFEKFGIFSFEIMATHLVIFKLIDAFTCHIFGINNINILTRYPYSFDKLVPVYVICALFVPVVIFGMLYNIKNKDGLYVKKYFNKIEQITSSKCFYIILIVLLVICISLPMLKLGIMHNDELMSRYWSSQGFISFYKHYFIEQVEKGRTLSSIIIPFTQYLGFIGQGTYSFKLLQIVSIIIVDYLFAKLLYKIFEKKNLSIIFFIFFMIFLPISFEPTVPNVFVTFYNISLMMLIYSFMLFWDYLQNGKTKKLVFSMIIFFIVELTYESFVTYVPIYLLLVLLKKGFKNAFKDIKCIILPILTGMIYLCLYFAFSKMFPSNYSGNQIGAINILNSIKILYELGKFTIPGSYALSGKYSYLYSFYYLYDIKNVITIIVIVILFISVLITTHKLDNNKKLKTSSLSKILILGIFMIILPILPISVASMYCDLDIGGNILGLPVSFFSYFGTIFVFTSIIIWIIDNCPRVKYIVFICLAILVSLIQSMNFTFSRIANDDFKRIEFIESFMKSGILENYASSEIYSTDLFELKDALYIHDEYWNEFNSTRNHKIKIKNSEFDNNHLFLIFDDVNNIFILKNKNKYYLFSKKPLNNCYEYEINGESKKFEFNFDCQKSGEWYICVFIEEKSIKQCDCKFIVSDDCKGCDVDEKK